MTQSSSSIHSFKCHKCVQSFELEFHLKIHVTRDHSTRAPFDCAFCDYTTALKRLLKQHIDTVHLKLKRFQCDECHQLFAQSCHLKQHVDSIHKRLRFDCSFVDCDKTFTAKRHLSTHFKLHEGKLNLCDECGKSLTTPAILIRHKQQVHARSRPFICTIDGCIKSFKVKGDLSNHLKLVHGPKLYQCSSCSKSFARNADLKKHFAAVHDQIRHQCNQCAKSYSQRATLQRHIQQHH